MSIFSINDNSNYNSILSQAKANKESKENSKISFANAFLKQNAAKLNEIQNANSQTLARSEVLNSTNNNINKNYYTKTNSPNYDISSEFKNSIYTLKYKQADISNNTSTNTAYGYSVDKDGYMGEDFNEAAGLPKDFKIHKSTLDEIERFNQHNMADETSGNYYNSFNMASIVKSYYNNFNQVTSAFPNDKTSFSEVDINTMPKGYSINGFYNGYGIFQDPDPIRNNDIAIKSIADYSDVRISNVYKTSEQFDEADSIYSDSGGLISGIKPETLGLSLEEIKNVSQAKYECDFKPDMSFYPKNEDGSYTREDLFMSLIKSQEGRVLYSPNTTLNPKVEAYNTAIAKESFNGPAINIDTIMTDKTAFKDFFRYWAERGIADGELYMYEKGISPKQALGNWALDAEIKQAIANGWKASSESINSFADSIADRLNNLIGQTRV
ncbi:Cj0814 family flagellar-dependent secreted protein [Campylobacter sp. LH-2024]|uniref:Cj0814 family flagellar-dependent secreted protein n=1 Tax=Campylobacter sp. LH-2024 TaxID=3239825 RepID=UPI003B78670E